MIRRSLSIIYQWTPTLVTMRALIAYGSLFNTSLALPLLEKKRVWRGAFTCIQDYGY
jgi:hypothetical protein